LMYTDDYIKHYWLGNLINKSKFNKKTLVKIKFDRS